ncbi:MAG: hypothetical protein QNJ60_18310 [Xenococcaceae cyanobacterium MO_188.B19]|nr:hypothetical protein [Xenococcaceae cyanobacterium MO_188.B19]
MLEKAANGSAEDQTKLTEYLRGELENDSVLQEQVQKLAEEIHLEITNNDIQARNVQNVTGQAQGLQVNDPNQPVIQAGDNAKFYFNTTPNPK